MYESLLDLVGNTPLVRLNRLCHDLNFPVLAKLEMFNPMSSVKDRVAREMIDTAERQGLLVPGKSTVVEATSGNTGIGLAMVAKIRGYHCVIIMPDHVSVERRELMGALGAEVILTRAEDGFQATIDTAEGVLRQRPNAWMARQFENPANPGAHYQTTGQEILRDTAGQVDVLVCGLGTGGTLSGTGRALKDFNPDIQVIAVEPENCALLSGGDPGRHKLQGLNAGFIADTTDRSIIDDVITVSDEAAFEACRQAVAREGLFVGPSAGAALCGALEYANRAENSNRQIVTVLPDSGERYLSTPYW
ncbi:cysteine synthase A [Roseibium sp. RKSG952]|nr:cysteine synthase A [Roseibium sp. RKSG952]